MKKAAIPLRSKVAPATATPAATAPMVDEAKLAALLRAPAMGESERTTRPPMPAPTSATVHARDGRQGADTPRRRADKAAGELVRVQVHLPADVEHALRALTLADRCSISHAVEQSLRATLKRRGVL